MQESKKPEPKPTIDYYQDVKVSREDLKGLLKTQFTSYGIADRIPEAEYTVEHESSWIWNNGNGKSMGLAAFTRGTWNENCHGKYDDMNPLWQLQCMAKLWARGEDWRWDVWCMKYGRNNAHCIARGF